MSGAGVLAVSSDGKINVAASTSTNMLIDVQGYYTAGNGTTAAGGYVPVPAANIVSATTIPSLGTVTMTIAGAGGVPANASAAMLNFTVVNTNSVYGYLTPYPADATPPSTSLNYSASSTTALSASVDLSADGKIKLYSYGSGSVSVSVQIEGYFTAAGDATGTPGQFTPAATRAYDSRVSPAVAIASGATQTITVAGRNGVPLVGSGLSALALQVAVIPGTSATGHLQVWPDDKPVGPAFVQYYAGSVQSNFMVVQPGADGGINIQNSSSGSINVVVDVEGWYSSVGAAIPNGQSRTQLNLTLQGTANGGGNAVFYQYREGTTAAFTSIPVANVTVPGTTTHPSAWPAARNSGGTFDPYTWKVKDTLAAVHSGVAADTLIQVQACFNATTADPPTRRSTWSARSHPTCSSPPTPSATPTPPPP